MHKVLERQLKRIYGKGIDPEQFSPNERTLFDAISQTYDEFNKERRHIEHTLEISARELEEANRKIRLQNEDVLNLLEQYKYAIDSALIVSMTDTRGIITYANDNFCKISGYSREELIGKPHNIVRHPDNAPSIFEDLWHTIQSKKIWQKIIPNLTKNGQTYYVHSTIIPLLDRNGSIAEYMSIREDVTEQITFQRQLQYNEQRTSAILNNQESIIVISRENEGVIEVNQKFYNSFGFKDFSDFKKKYHCVCELFVEKEGYLKQSTETTYWIEPLLLHPDHLHRAIIRDSKGDLRTYSVKMTSLTLDEQRTYISTFTDITELEKAREKAETAEKIKAEFLANMSHEIRTPMNGILGFIQLLTHSSLNDKQKQYVELIHKSTETLLSIINDILDFSKIESGKIETEKLPINLFSELESTFFLLSEKAKEKHLTYHIEIDPHISECVRLDSVRLKQVLLNLIGNAIKFTPQGGSVLVDVRLVSQTSEDNTIEFNVIDTGIGIPAERQDKIFDPFSQADSSTTRKFGGTGLGLSISRSLVEMMGGSLKLESTPEYGSRFFFSITVESCSESERVADHLASVQVCLIPSEDPYYPKIIDQLDAFGIHYEVCSDDKPIDDCRIVITTDLESARRFEKGHCILINNQSQECHENGSITCITNYDECPSTLYNTLLRFNTFKTERPVYSSSSPTYNLNLLIAEDYEINRVLMEELLGHYGLMYEFAINGEEAVIMAQNKSYDLIFMDINMPIMNGIEATQAIRAFNQTIPIIALTANALDGDKERFLNAGMEGYLTKPIDLKALQEVLQRYGKPQPQSILPTDLLSEKEIQDALNQTTEKMGLSQAIIKKFLESFLKSIDHLLNLLKEGIETNNLQKIEHAMHDIKSGTATLGLAKVSAEAQKIEKYAREGKSYPYEEAFSYFQENVKRLEAYYERHIKGER